jgi:nicotinamide-nucleotide amidase
MPTDSVVHQLAIRVSNRLRDERLMLVTAESCTGGMVATAITDISGSSGWFERGFVTYSNQAKSEMIGVPGDLIDKHGAVSEPVARAMAEGALRNSRAQVSLSITGVAGPGGGTETKPVGATGCIHRWKRRYSRATANRSACRPRRMRCAACSRCSTSANIDPRSTGGNDAGFARKQGRTDPPLRSEAASGRRFF